MAEVRPIAEGDEVYDDPSIVTAANGVVKATGPDSLDLSLTPQAAVETGARLIEAAARAQGQHDISAGRKPPSE
jgi:hypothetical protein